ncbi:MAG: hypothetical protein QXW42_04125 [Thermofilum sp.]
MVDISQFIKPEKLQKPRYKPVTIRNIKQLGSAVPVEVQEVVVESAKDGKSTLCIVLKPKNGYPFFLKWRKNIFTKDELAVLQLWGTDTDKWIGKEAYLVVNDKKIKLMPTLPSQITKQSLVRTGLIKS